LAFYLERPSLTAISKKINFGSKKKFQAHEESHIVLGYTNMVAGTTTMLL
jgi:hypothetical protein